jgi:hypothetical protein
MPDPRAPEGAQLAALVDRIEKAAAESVTALDVQEALGVTREDDMTPLGAISAAFSYLESHDPNPATGTYFGPISQVGRELLLQMEVPVFNTARGGMPGGYSGLGVLIARLEERGFDPSWNRYITVLLSRQEGLNLRNEFAHGTIDNVDETLAGLTLIATLYLAIAVGAGPTEA